MATVPPASVAQRSPFTTEGLAALLHAIAHIEFNAINLALDAVSLDVPPGTAAVIVGPSGCGKSTLLNLVGGLDRPTSGEVILNGRSTNAWSSGDWTRARRELVGIVFQAFHLLPGLTAAENIGLPLVLRGEAPAVVAERVARQLASVGLEDRALHRPSELSGGEQQRIAVARALIHRPRLLLADEPTGNLDSHAAAELIALLRRLSSAVSKIRGRTGAGLP